MTLTVEQLLAAKNALDKLNDAPVSTVLKLRVGLMLGRIMPEIKSAHAATLAVYRKHGTATKKADGTDSDEIIVPPENMAAFLADITPIVEMPIDLDVRPLPFAVAEALIAAAQQSGVELSGGELIQLQPFIAEE
ncbi:MAG: hypothetical protein NVS9B4_01110 [Candidatus Acidiferrum sp.]